MTFLEWAAQPWPDGVHELSEFPLDALHPLRHGALALRFHVNGGIITACSFDVHANHRGDEKLLEVRTYPQGLALINRHGWLTAPFAEALYVRIIESMLGISINARVRALRDLAMALNAAAVDAYWRYLDASLAGQPSEALAEREAWLAEFEALTGARMHGTYVRVGGVAADAEPTQLERLLAAADGAVARAAEAVVSAHGPVTVALPKVLRLPEGEAYDELETPHGRLGIWVFSRGDKVPLRVHLRTAGFAALSSLEARAAGMRPEDLLLELARTRLVLGEVSR